MSDAVSFLILFALSCTVVYILNYLRRIREEFGIYRRVAALEEAVFLKPVRAEKHAATLAALSAKPEPRKRTTKPTK